MEPQHADHEIAAGQQYIPRGIEPTLQRACREFPVVVLTGPRQSGKTTVLRHLLGTTHDYVTLEPPDARAAATSDPRGFLERDGRPLVIDEVQNAPQLLEYIKERVDVARDRPGQYVLSGSQNLLLLSQVSESLAGMALPLRLLPLSLRELDGAPQRLLAWEAGHDEEERATTLPQTWSRIVRGCYPELAAHPDRDPVWWQAAYVETYLERDVRTVRQVGDLVQFQAFMRALAARNGTLLNLSGLGRDLGLTDNTVKAWLSVLEASQQVVLLRPYFANIGRRLVKTPKVYFLDTGTVCSLVGLSDAVHASRGPMAGTLMESLVLGELIKTFRNRGAQPRISFWRTGRGEEVDFVVETAEGLVPLEVKTSATPLPRMAAGIRAMRGALDGGALPGYVVHPGDSRLPLGDGDRALPLAML
jgi:predicted AAA+ superfamily ATPase